MSGVHFNPASSAITQQQQLSQKANAAATFAGVPVRKTSLAQLLHNMAEEISFEFQEANEAEDSQEERVEDQKAAMFTALIARIQEVWEQHNEAYNQGRDRVRRHMEHQSGSGAAADAMAELKRVLDEASGGDKSLGLALISGMAESGELPQYLGSEQEADNFARAWAMENAVAIRAGLNTKEVSEAFSEGDCERLMRLQSFYQDHVAKEEASLSVLIDVVREFGVERFEAGKDYLMRASARDLNSGAPSQSKAQIRFDLEQLKLLKHHNTMRRSVDDIMMRGGEPMTKAFPDPALLTGLYTFLGDPLTFEGALKSPSLSLPLERQALMFQDLLKIVRDIPPSMIGSDAEERKVMGPILEHCDDLVYDQGA